MTVTVLLLACLAAYRITRLITLDDIAEPVRVAWWTRFPATSRPGEMISCPYCVGVYASALVVYATAALGFAPWRWRTIALWPAVAGGQALLNAVDDRLNH